MVMVDTPRWFRFLRVSDVEGCFKQRGELPREFQAEGFNPPSLPRVVPLLSPSCRTLSVCLGRACRRARGM